MPDLNKTKYFYKEKELNDYRELDYLDTNIHNMRLETTDVFEITAPFEFRPDLVSLKVFGDYHYGWLIAMHNDFLDPVFSLTVGREIDIPNIDDYFDFYAENTFSRSRDEKIQ